MSTSTLTRPTRAVRDPAATADRAARHPGIALAVIVTVQLMVVLDATVVNISLPGIQRGLGFSVAGLSWVINAYTLAFGGLLLLGGRAGDVLGRRQMFVGGLGLFTLASLLGGLAQSAEWLVIARVVQGVGAAAAAPSALALIATNFAEGAPRNRALSIFAAVSSGGASVGLILGGLLTGISWRWVLFINVPVGLLAMALAPRFLADSERNHGTVDYVGALASVAGMGSLVYGLIRTGSDGWGDPTALTTLGVGAVIMAGFLAYERKVATPVVPLRLFADRNRAGAYALMLLLPSAMFGVFFYLTQFLQEDFGYSALQTGVAFLPLTALIFGASRIAPRLMPRFGVRPMLVVGMTLAALGLFGLTQLHSGGGYASHVLAPIMLLGLGVGLSFMPITATILAGVDRSDSGAASSLLQTMQQVGGTLGLAVLVTVFGAATHHAGVVPGTDHVALPLFTHGLRYAFGTAGVLAAAGVAVAALVIRPLVRRPSAAESLEDDAAEPLIAME